MHTRHIAEKFEKHVRETFADDWEAAATHYGVNGVFIADVIVGSKYPNNEMLKDIENM